MNRIVLLQDTIDDIIDDVVDFAPRLLGALIILILGWIIGRFLGSVVRRLVRRTGIDRRMRGTRVASLFQAEDGFSWAVGRITSYYIYLIAILAAADVLEIAVLSEWLDTAVSYIPSFIAGVLVIFLGLILADYIARMIRESPVSKRAGFAPIVAMIVQLFLYFVVLTIGLGTMGVDTTVLVVLVTAFVGGLGLALALGIGLAVGLGGQDYVADHLAGWVDSVDETVTDLEEETE